MRQPVQEGRHHFGVAKDPDHSLKPELVVMMTLVRSPLLSGMGKWAFKDTRGSGKATKDLKNGPEEWSPCALSGVRISVVFLAVRAAVRGAPVCAPLADARAYIGWPPAPLLGQTPLAEFRELFDQPQHRFSAVSSWLHRLAIL